MGCFIFYMEDLINTYFDKEELEFRLIMYFSGILYINFISGLVNIVVFLVILSMDLELSTTYIEEINSYSIPTDDNFELILVF
jgi:hypothetical protein